MVYKQFTVVVLYYFMFIYCMFSMAYSAKLKDFIDVGKVPENMKAMAQFRFHFFTIWNYTLQIIFLLVAVMDETSKLVNMSILQKRLEKCRTYLFSSLVLPSSLLVATIFWSIWHIDRELIFPKAIDDFYPSWLNHTLHTFILIPLIVELMVQINNENFRISKLQAGMTFLIYCTIYQSLYMFVYFKHGVWLYPIYKILSWTQRVAFTLFQLFLAIGYQQIAILILNNENKPKIKLNID